jgi:DNA-binding NarL/FixJ family response regulator
MHLMIVEDHALVREGFRMILEGIGRFDDTVECGSLASALARARGLGQDLGLIVLDLGLPDVTGFEGLDQIVSLCPAVPVLVVSGETTADAIRGAFAHGARGFVPKNSSGPAFRAAVEAILRGERYVPPQVLAGDLPAPPRPRDAQDGAVAAERLTTRQGDVLRLLARGLTNKEIAHELDMSPATVRVHVTAILKVLGVENRTQAAISDAARLLGDRGADR